MPSASGDLLSVEVGAEDVSRAPFSKYTLREAAEILIDHLHVCDDEARQIADRISGLKGEEPQCPDGVQVLEDVECVIRAALEHSLDVD